jgi:hypothetical protein
MFPPRLGFTVGIIHHLLSLSSNYLELRTIGQELLPSIAHRIILPDKCFANMSYCEIPVKVPRAKTQIMTSVSPEDHSMLKSIAPVWRMNGAGYVICSKRTSGKYRLVYMHRVVAGGPAKHLNGDRLDNRRENLIPTKPRRPFIELSPLDMSTGHPIGDLDPVQSVEEAILSEPTGKYTTVTYSNGYRYCGEMHNSLPHGFGTLLEKNRSSFGWFLYGQFKSGCVLDHPDVCDRLRYLYQQPYIRPITDAFAVRSNGKHERFM